MSLPFIPARSFTTAPSSFLTSPNSASSRSMRSFMRASTRWMSDRSQAKTATVTAGAIQGARSNSMGKGRLPDAGEGEAAPQASQCRASRGRLPAHSRRACP